MGYHPEQFSEDWVYAIAKDFKSPNGEAAQWASGQPAGDGQEQYRIPLSSTPTAASANANGTLMALGQEHDIHVYNINDMSLHQVLKGHISRVDTLEFHPTDPNKLLSSAMNQRGGSVKAEPVIIFWNVEKKQELLDETVIKDLGARAASVVADNLKELTSTWTMSHKEREDLAQDVASSLTALNIKSTIQAMTQIHGRLAHNFGSHTYNCDGTSMVYLPGPRPRSNTVDDWDICIWDTGKQEIKHTLKGHTDSLMWIGFSPNDELIASVSWDQTFRIWSHANGQLLHVFKSNQQNWTGGFSPDSRFFAGTSGDGHLFIFDVVQGIEIAVHDFRRPSGWFRTLSWSPHGKQLVLGGRDCGPVFVYDIESRSMVQERLLSTKKCPEESRRFIGGHLEICSAQYLDGGRKIAYKMPGDGSVEVYDFEENRKWRFAPEAKKQDWQSDLLVFERVGLIASMDADAVRFWKIPLRSKC